MEMTKKKAWGPIIGIAIGVGIMTGISNVNRTSPYKELSKFSKEINAKGAVTIDPDTRMDSTSVAEDPLMVVYHYTVVTVDKDSVTIDEKEAKEVLIKQTQENLDNSPDMETFRKHDVSMKYDYKDKKGRHLFDFTIKPAKNIQ